jgi:DNA-binding NtrC family response regulator
MESRSQAPFERPALDILLVEDEPDVLDALQQILMERGHRVTATPDGAEAMRFLDNRRFDAALCDIRVPNVDGMQIFQRMRRETPSSHVILMSAYGSVAEAVEAMKEKATHYLAKPFSVEVLLDLIERVEQDHSLRRQLEQAGRARSPGQSAIMGNAPALVRLRELVAAIAESDSAVLLTGESGTGKELVACEIHHASRRAHKPLVAVNCAAFPDTLLEAELFGHERGAFTGAFARREGRFKAADGGTLFLDEVAEMSLMAQAKLLRVLEERCYQRLGSNETVPVDLRLISATNTDVRDAVRDGRLREDIFHRLKVFQLHLPPLRERRGDLPVLINYFHRQFGGDHPLPLRIAPRAWAALRHYNFPGNVRELKHVVEHALVLSGGDEVDLEHLPEEVRGEPIASTPRNSPLPLVEAVRSFERDYLLRALRRCQWHKGRTAEMLGISRKTLWQKLKAYGIDGPDA